MHNLGTCCLSETATWKGTVHSSAWLRQFCLLGLAFQCVFTIGCGRSSQNSSENGGKSGTRSSVDQAFAADGTMKRVEGTITIAKDAGVAAQFVASFFENWKRRDFEAMHGQMVNAGDQSRFCMSMKNTPAQWKSVQIGNGPESEADVALRIETTDLPSVMGAYFFCNARNSPVRQLVSREKPFPATPFSLNIETFCVITQSWHLVRQSDVWKIDYGLQPRENVLHYFVYAGRSTYAKLSYDEATPFMPGNMMFEMARVLQELSEGLGMPSADTDAVIAGMKTKADQAMRNYRKHL